MQSERISKTALSGMEKLNALALRAKNKKLPSRWVVKAAPDAMYKPFPLSDMQQAYWIGRDKDIGGGGVAMQSYVEIDCPALDVARLQRGTGHARLTPSDASRGRAGRRATAGFAASPSPVRA